MAPHHLDADPDRVKQCYEAIEQKPDHSLASRNMPTRNTLDLISRPVRYRLLVPLKRSRHSPEYTARGVMVGMFWAMTPFVGIQMGLVLGTWALTTRLFKWDFSIINGLAWTWVTNVFTLLPFYYLFFVTGNLMLGEGGDISGYGQFVEVWNNSFDSAEGGLAAVAHWFDTMVKGWGLPMVVGSIPWAILSAWGSYVLSLKFVQKIQERRAAARAAISREAARQDAQYL